MFLTEMYEEAKPGYQSEKDDNSVMHLKDLRKTRLTLAHLNRLRMANDVRKFEFEKKMEQTQKQYVAPAAEAGAMPGM
jgi:hypothetical protein